MYVQRCSFSLYEPMRGPSLFVDISWIHTLWIDRFRRILLLRDQRLTKNAIFLLNRSSADTEFRELKTWNHNKQIKPPSSPPCFTTIGTNSHTPPETHLILDRVHMGLSPIVHREDRGQGKREKPLATPAGTARL